MAALEPAGPEGAAEPEGAPLAAPGRLATVGAPTVQAVRLRWDPVAGARGYLVYRSTTRPGGDYLGLPIGEVESGNE